MWGNKGKSEERNGGRWIEIDEKWRRRQRDGHKD
jgi:hypothetical protein